MMDQNSPEPPRKRSFFDDDSMEASRSGQGRENMIRGQDPRMNPAREDDGRLSPRQNRSDPNGRERMASRYHEEDDEEDEYDEDYDRRGQPRFAFMQNLFHGDSSTRRLAYAAAGIGGILLLFIGGWMMSHTGHQGIPVFEPPQIAAKEKPLPENNTETIGMDKAEGQMEANGKPVLAPGPEQADPSALAAQYGTGNSTASNNQTPVVTNVNGNVMDNGVSSPNNVPLVAAPSTATSSMGNDLPENKNKKQAQSKEDEGNVSDEQSDEAEKSVAPVPSKKPIRHHRQDNGKKVPSVKLEEKRVGNGHFIVQLAALGSNAAAQKQWQVMRKKAPELLGQYSPTIQKANVKGNTIYRIRIKGFTSKTQANSFCSQLKTKSLSCTLANF